MSDSTVSILREAGIKPSAQRVAVAELVLEARDHPSADQVWNRVRRVFPHISRATVYNTLKLFVESGLLRRVVLMEGHVVFDPHVARHHHFIDERNGSIHDIPWEAVAVSNIDELEGYEVREFQVVLRGDRTEA